MRFPGYTEVSGVCTHPDFHRRGLARRLSAAVMAGIAARGDGAFPRPGGPTARRLPCTRGWASNCEPRSTLRSCSAAPAPCGWRGAHSRRQPGPRVVATLQEGHRGRVSSQARAADEPAHPPSKHPVKVSSLVKIQRIHHAGVQLGG
jgi:hypothetical protein